jgi:hypothetical protein
VLEESHRESFRLTSFRVKRIIVYARALMFDDAPEPGGTPSSLRGWLSDVYLPALLDGSIDALVKRLGGRATVDDPVFGRASGLPALERYLKDASKWLADHGAAFTRLHFTTGADRDVTEGRLAIRVDSRPVEIPIAVVAERRRSREVEVRLYYPTHAIKGTHAVRSPLVGEDKELVLPAPIHEHVQGLGKADVTAVVDTFETEGAVREAGGAEHAKKSDLRAFYEKLFGTGGIEVVMGGVADDGRTCALEFTLVKFRGKTVPPQAGLTVYERGDSGLLRSVRIYDDLLES